MLHSAPNVIYRGIRPQYRFTLSFIRLIAAGAVVSCFISSGEFFLYNRMALQ